MSKKVYHLKRATPRMKYQHMKNMMEFKEDLKTHQEKYVEPKCSLCSKDIGVRPLWMVGKYDICYSCFRLQEEQATKPKKEKINKNDS